MRRKVFISSVMRGFEGFRHAAKSAVETLRHYPVMAEDFGAVPSSPQMACLEGVRQSEVYIGVFGERYGNRVESGLSPTEEEFREAQRRGIDVLCFVSQGPLDEDQEKFVDSIKGYESGQMLAFFDTPEELSKLIIRSLNDLSMPSAQGGLSAEAAQERFNSRLSNHQGYRNGEPKLRLSVVPERQVDEYLSPNELGNNDLRENLQQDLLFGPNPRLFSIKRGVQVYDGEDYVRLWQGEDEQHFDVAVALYSDGSIIMEDVLREERSNRHSLTRGFVVDESRVEQSLLGYLRFCERTFSSLPSFRHVSAYFFWMQLVGMNDKKYGRIPEPEPNSIQMGGSSLGDLVNIPEEPQRIAASQLRDGETFSQNVLTRVIRKFRAAGGYFECH